MKDAKNINTSGMIDWWDNLSAKKKAAALTILSMSSILFMLMMIAVFPIVVLVILPIGFLAFIAWMLYTAIYAHLKYKEKNKTRWWVD